MSARGRFKFIGDWLISRSDSPLGGFQIGVCINIIRSEGVRDGWLYQLTDEDITRILARYKEHVTYWNIRIDIIRGELQALADALGRGFYEIASKFDALEPKRIPPEIVYTQARIRKDTFVPYPRDPNRGNWVPTQFTLDEVGRLQGALFSGYPAAAVRVTMNPIICDLKGVFERSNLEAILHQAQENQAYFEGKPVQYEILSLF